MSHRSPPRTPSPRLAAYAVLVAAGAGVLAACGHSAPTRFFTLDPVAPAAPPASAYAGPPLKLTAVDIPPALDREELVSELSGGEVRVHDFEHWEAPLGQVARQAMILDLAARLPAGAVLGPSAPGGAGVATLSADIVSFQAGPGGATLQAGWSLTLPGLPDAPTPRVWRAPLAELQAPAAGGDGAATAEAFSALLAKLSDQIAAALPAQVARLQAEQFQAAAGARAAAVASRPRTTTLTLRTETVRSGTAQGGAGPSPP